VSLCVLKLMFKELNLLCVFIQNIIVMNTNHLTMSCAYDDRTFSAIYMENRFIPLQG
jgi:hypothetical protein